MAFVMPITEISYGRLSKHTYDENSGYLLGISEGLNLLLTFGTKFMVKRKRPYAALENVYHRENVGTDPYSFPSGHTSITFTIAALFNLRYPKYPQVYVPMYLYSLIVAYGRPYFGMHYPTDLLGGAVIGTGSSILIFSLRNHLFRLKNKILSESKDDTGSINGNNIILFGCAFIISNLIGQLIAEKNDKINMSYMPDGTGGRFNIRVKF
jgi:hypothetical protein